MSIHRFVHPGHSLTLGRNLRHFIALDKDDLKIEPDSYDNGKRNVPAVRSGGSQKSFRDMRCTFTEEQVQKEAARCLGCGATTVDPNQCIGCGVCTCLLHTSETSTE